MRFLKAAWTGAGLLLAAGCLMLIQPLASSEAEAAKVRINPVGAAAGIVRHHNRNSESSENSDESAAEATSDEGADSSDGGTAAKENAKDMPLRAKVIAPAAPKPAPEPPKDLEVAGCPPGMLCTICIAGCVAGPQSIVHAAPKGMRAN